MTAGRRNTRSESYDWGTPAECVEAVREALGGRIAFDPCSNPWSVVEAEEELSIEAGDDGLAASWNRPTIFVNPPYGRDPDRGTSIDDWLSACREANARHGAEVVALVPVATNTGHWKRHVWGHAAAICFLAAPRLPFLRYGQRSGKGAPMACCTIYWGGDPERFCGAFAGLGETVRLTS